MFSSPLNHKKKKKKKLKKNLFFFFFFFFFFGGGGVVMGRLVGRKGVHIYELSVNTVMGEALLSYESL